MSEHCPTTAFLDVQELSVAIAHLASREGAFLGERIPQVFGIALPRGARLTHAGPVRLLGISPGRWWVIREPADYDLAADLASLLRPAAAVCDLSDAFTVLRLRGPAVRATLARLLPIDLHARAFVIGQVAATVSDHTPVTFWRMPDEEGAAFEMAVPRSYASTWREVLAEAAAGAVAAAEPSGR